MSSRKLVFARALPLVSILMILFLFGSGRGDNIAWEKDHSELPLPESQGHSQDRLADYDLAVYYFVPSNEVYSAAVHRRLIDAIITMQNCYRCATGGLAWTFAYPETVKAVYGPQTREYYLNNGDWWGSLPDEMSTVGHPIWIPGTICVLWAHRAGWWASAAQWCGVEFGLAMLGVEAFPEFKNPAYSGGLVPAEPVEGLGHVLQTVLTFTNFGHTHGLPHPGDIAETASSANHSVMQTHWTFADYGQPSELPWRLLTREIDPLYGNPFMKSLPEVSVPTLSCNLANIPSRSPQPAADFSFLANGSLNVDFFNFSQGATRYWWHFVDETDSHLHNPNHTFPTAGNYIV